MRCLQTCSKIAHVHLMVVQAAMVAKLDATAEQQGASNLLVDMPPNSDESGDDSPPGTSRPEGVAAGKVPAQKRARQTQAAWKPACSLPGSSAAPEAARPVLVKTIGFCAYPVRGNEILARMIVRHCFMVSWQGASAVVLQAEATGIVMQGPKHDAQLRRKGFSSKENQTRLPAVKACQPSEPQVADTSHSSKPVVSRGEPLPLSESGCFRSVCIRCGQLHRV